MQTNWLADDMKLSSPLVKKKKISSGGHISEAAVRRIKKYKNACSGVLKWENLHFISTWYKDKYEPLIDIQIDIQYIKRRFWHLEYTLNTFDEYVNLWVF